LIARLTSLRVAYSGSRETKNVWLERRLHRERVSVGMDGRARAERAP
jgi:hypothetical protein